MSSIVDEQILERLTSLDIKLIQRFGRRTTERLARLLARTTSQWGPRSAAIQESDNALGACLGGLEVSFNAGSTVNVTRGAMAFTNNARVTEARPGSWTGNVEPDDDDWTLYELAGATTAVPATPIPGALAQAEWWIVYGVIAGAGTIESDSARKVFNEVNGNYDPAVFAKIKGATLTPAVYRGAGGATLATAFAAAQAITAAPPIAFIWVPAGSTDLSTAEFFDTRRLVYEDRGANRVEGSWSNPQQGTVSTPFGSKPVFQGVVRARLGGEWLECRSAQGLDLTMLCSPGAVWPAAGVGGIAWLYLAKVQGLVPRLKSIGSSPLGIASNGQAQSGVLVLSPVPPRIRETAAGSSSKAAQRWDLRNSASIALPSANTGTVQFNYAGSTAPADDAICVGFMIYSNVDGASNIPNVVGPGYCDDGWMSGQPLSSFAAALGTLGVSGGTPACAASITLATVVSAGDTVTLPFDGVSIDLRGTVTAWGQITWSGQESKQTQYPSYDGTSAFYFAHASKVRTSCPGAATFSTHAGSAAAGNFSIPVASLIAVRMPYGEPLIT